jgi:hypothetical protein
MLGKYYFYVWVFLCINACSSTVNTYQFDKIESLIQYENKRVIQNCYYFLEKTKERYENNRHLREVIDSHYLHFLDSFMLLNQNFVTQMENNREALNFTNPQTFATQNAVAQFVNTHRQNSQIMLKKLYAYNAPLLENLDTPLQAHLKKQIQNLIDSAYILTETPLFNLQKLNYEEMRLCFLLLQSETYRIENQTMLICYQLFNSNLNLIFDKLVFIPNFRYQKRYVGDTCEIAFNIYYPSGFRKNDYLVFQKDTIRNHTPQRLYTFPTNKIGKQQLDINFYIVNGGGQNYWGEYGRQRISYEVVE